MIFFDGFFLKVHLEIQENRLDAVSERFRQYKPSKFRVPKNYNQKQSQTSDASSVRERLCYIPHISGFGICGVFREKKGYVGFRIYWVLEDILGYIRGYVRFIGGYIRVIL